MVDPEKGLSAEADKAGTAVGAAGGSRSAAQQQHCCDFYKIVRFYEEGGDSINEHKVELVQWRPSWSTRPPKCECMFPPPSILSFLSALIEGIQVSPPPSFNLPYPLGIVLSPCDHTHSSLAPHRGDVPSRGQDPCCAHA